MKLAFENHEYLDLVVDGEGGGGESPTKSVKKDDDEKTAKVTVVVQNGDGYERADGGGEKEGPAATPV